ncbi:MAG: PKD domain-containing protein, partial [Bacteroidota bacterium]
SPSYTYTTAGDFEVRLRVTDQSGCTSTKEREVHVIPPNDRPVASFEINKTEICVSEVVRLTSNSTGNVDFWCWNLGDGSTLQTTQPILNFAYRDVGVYTISLSVSYKGCPSEETYVLTDVVTVLEPKPEFSVVKNCADPYTIELSNSTQNADSFFWSFGDGETTSEQDPGTHTYAQTGNYTLSLEATNNTTGCTVRSLSSITIYDVESDFSVSNNRVCINEAVDFTDLSTDAVRWLWDFEDGRTSFTASPKNISFTDPGKYTISLTAYDQDDCSDKLEKMDFVVVADIQGRFRENRLNNFCDSLKVEFQDLSFASPAIDEWTWDFGDGTTSSDQNPVHTYSDFGEYTVSLTVQNIEGRCTVLQNDLVVFTEPRPDFQFTKNAFCVGEEVAAFNSSRNAQTYFWYVNNDTIESPNLVTSFPEKGRYQITLASFDRDNCSNQIAKEVSIQKPVADFEAQQISAECPPLISTFLSKSSDQVVNWDWRINDDFFSSVENPSHTFDIPGDYDVSLVVADDLGCTDSIRVNELIQLGGPFGEYAVSDSAACLTQNVEFSVVASNSVTYIWDFGNGVVQTTDSPAISHRYAEVGAYNPSLILEDEFGCRVSPVQDIQINIFDTTGVAFTIPANYPFTGESIEVIFDDLPDGNWTWDMGDGTTISNDLPQYAYAEGGTYNVQLSFINENGCKSQFNQTVFIQEDLKFIPNVFTPNGDIANDTFDMLDLEKGFWNVKIFNRNGVLVFDKESYDGTWTARNVAAGTYYYVVVNQFRKEKTYKGYIQVLK